MEEEGEDGNSYSTGDCEIQFQELGQQLCEQIEEATTVLTEEGKKDDALSSDAFLQQLCALDENFTEAKSCRHMMTDAKLTKCLSKLVFTEVQNVHKDAAGKTIDLHYFVQKLSAFLQQQCSMTDETDEITAANQQMSWAAFGDRFMNDILRLPPSMSCLGPLLPSELPKEVLSQVIKRKVERTKLKKTGEALRLQEIEEDELIRRTDPLAKKLDNVMHCLRKCLKQRGTGSINYFEFCFHPTDFSRSVANAFYTSFLVKENKVGLDIGCDNMPQLSLVRSAERAELIESDSQISRGIISFSYGEWEEVVKLLNISIPLITDA